MFVILLCVNLDKSHSPLELTQYESPISLLRIFVVEQSVWFFIRPPPRFLLDWVIMHTHLHNLCDLNSQLGDRIVVCNLHRQFTHHSIEQFQLFTYLSRIFNYLVQAKKCVQYHCPLELMFLPVQCKSLIKPVQYEDVARSDARYQNKFIVYFRPTRHVGFTKHHG